MLSSLGYSTLAYAPPSPTATLAPEAETEAEAVGLFCPSLPSSNTVNDLLDGKWSALPWLARDMTVRTAVCALGAYVVGLRGADNVWRAGLGGALGIEVGVVALTVQKRRQEGVGRR